MKETNNQRDVDIYCYYTVSSDTQVGFPGISSCMLNLKFIQPIRIGFSVQIFLEPITRSSSEIPSLRLTASEDSDCPL